MKVNWCNFLDLSISAKPGYNSQVNGAINFLALMC